MSSSPIISWQIDGETVETVANFIWGAQSCLTLCDPMNRSTPDLPVQHQLPEFTETHVHRVSDAIQPSHPRSSSSPPAPNPSQRQSFPMSQLFAWGGQSTVVSALASFLPEKSQGWSPLEWTGWISLQSKGTLKESSPITQFKSMNSLALSFLYSPTLTSIHDHWKNHSVDYGWRTFVGKVMSLLLNMLSRLVITFLPRSKRLLISWLQSPSAVILEHRKNKVSHCFHCFPIYLPWS